MPLSPALLMTLGQMDPSLLLCRLRSMGIGRRSLHCLSASASVLLALFWALLPCPKQQEQRLSQLPVLLRCLKEHCGLLLLGLQKQ